MANIRTLKKVINAVAFDVIDECFYRIDAGAKNSEEIMVLLSDAINFRNSFIASVNTAKKSDDTKVAIREISDALEDVTYDFLERLNNLG